MTSLVDLEAEMVEEFMKIMTEQQARGANRSQLTSTLIDYQHRLVRKIQNAENSGNPYEMVLDNVAAECGTTLIHNVLLWLERDDSRSVNRLRRWNVDQVLASF